jgi:hypothetical protein
VQVGRLGAVFRDRIWLLLKHLWYKVGVADIAKDGAAVNATAAGGMLRVVNVHDVAPDVPSAVRVPFFRCGAGLEQLCQRCGQYVACNLNATMLPRWGRVCHSSGVVRRHVPHCKQYCFLCCADVGYDVVACVHHVIPSLLL